MLSLSDTTIRMYRKKSGLVSFRLKSCLLVHTKVGFSLSAYLKKMECQLTLSSGLVIPMETSYTYHAQADHEMDTMVHFFWARGECEMESMRNGVAKLRMDYHFSFAGHPYEEPDYFEKKAPLVVKTRKYKGL
jgi:hypothetical protein